jgi:hypothetical protein
MFRSAKLDFSSHIVSNPLFFVFTGIHVSGVETDTSFDGAPGWQVRKVERLNLLHILLFSGFSDDLLSMADID